MAYFDGSKDKLGTLHYFERVAPHLNAGSVIVFDDIHWSEEMWGAWKVLRQRPGLSFAINAGRFGVCIWSGGDTRPKTIDLYKVMGVDLYKVKERVEKILGRPGVRRRV